MKKKYIYQKESRNTGPKKNKETLSIKTYLSGTIKIIKLNKQIKTTLIKKPCFISVHSLRSVKINVVLIFDSLTSLYFKVERLGLG